MSSENQQPTAQAESANNNTDKVSPFLTEPLPTGTPQGQQQSLEQKLTSTPTNGSVPKYNLPRGANTGNVGETTHFGFKTVNSEEKAQKVAEVFHSVASKYDIMNDLMSFGIHRLWKRFAINMSGVRRGQRVLDIAGGTGDLAKVFSREVGPTGHVVLSDINESMLNVGRDRLIDAGCTNVDFVLANAETLEPFEDNSFDLLTISFGLRNVTVKDAARFNVAANAFQVFGTGRFQLYLHVAVARIHIIELLLARCAEVGFHNCVKWLRHSDYGKVFLNYETKLIEACGVILLYAGFCKVGINARTRKENQSPEIKVIS